MWPVPAPGPQAPPVVVRSSSLSPSDSSIQSSADSFLKVKGASFDWIQLKGNFVASVRFCASRSQMPVFLDKRWLLLLD